jgi:hypothetical protein
MTTSAPPDELRGIALFTDTPEVAEAMALEYLSLAQRQA